MQRSDHVAWVAAAIGRDLTVAEAALVRILSVAVDNPWNIHPTWSILRSAGDHHASITVGRDLGTTEGDCLTRLVFAAHDECCRLTVDSGGPYRTTVSVWPRERGRHPTLEEAVRRWRERHPAEEVADAKA